MISAAAAAAAIAAAEMVVSRCPKEWLAGWLHALHASFVPKADCTFSSIGLTDRPTDRPRPTALLSIDKLPAALCWPRKILSLSFIERGARSLAHPCIKIACANGESGVWAFGRSGGRCLLVHSSGIF